MSKKVLNFQHLGSLGASYINSDISAEVTLKDGAPAGKWIERPIVEEIAVGFLKEGLVDRTIIRSTAFCFES